MGFFGYISYTIYNDPGSVTELKDVGSQSITDIVQWGRVKIGIDPLLDDPFKRRSFAEEMLLKGITEEDLKEEEEQEGEASETNGEDSAEAEKEGSEDSDGNEGL